MAYDPKDEADAVARGLSVEQLEQIQCSRGIGNKEIAQLAEPVLIKVLQKLHLPDRPKAREDYRRLHQADDRGMVARDGLARALEQLGNCRGAPGAAQTVAGIPGGRAVSARNLSPPPPAPGAGLQPTGAGWTSLGPGRVGGRTRAIVVDPGNAGKIWLGSAGGGVWHSTNAGANWHPVNDRMANLAIGSMVMDPTDSLTIYAGTGEGFSNADALRGAGIFHTTDGVNWGPLSAAQTSDFFYVNRLAMSHDGATLLAATHTGLWRSCDPARLMWQRVLAGNMADVSFHPTDASRAIAGGLRDGRAYHSSDGGVTWKIATPAWGQGRVELRYAAADPDTVYVSLDRDNGEIWRSRDGGQTYTQCAAKNAAGLGVPFLGQQGWYDNVIWAGDPTNVDLVLVGGIDLYRSTDGGDTLTKISNWQANQSAHADHHAIVSHPDYDGDGNRTVFFGNDGGIYRTDDATTVGNDPDHVHGWENLVNGYAVTQFYGGAGNPTTSVIVGGAQDNGTLAMHPAKGANGWVKTLGGDGGYCAADPTDPNFFYGEYVYLNIHRNDNGATSDNRWFDGYISGHFWNSAIGNWDWKPVPFTIPDARNNQALFIAPFVLDPNEPSRILAGGRSLWRTNDAKTPNTPASGPRWAAIKSPVQSLISAIAVAAGDSDRVYVGYANGEVYRSDDATAAAPGWHLVGAGGRHPLAPKRLCTRLLIDPSDHKRVYACFGGYTPDNLWRTDDDGATWADISGTLPDAPIRAIAIHPRKPDFLYAGTEVGVFSSETRGASWSPSNEGPTSCSVADLFWMDETLVCVTHGRGMFSIDLSGA